MAGRIISLEAKTELMSFVAQALTAHSCPAVQVALILPHLADEEWHPHLLIISKIMTDIPPVLAVRTSG
jgi:hypothetical protein